jgi:hypothetical protein
MTRLEAGRDPRRRNQRVPVTPQPQKGAEPVRFDDHSAGVRALDRLSEDRRHDDRLIKGLNFFKRSEQALLRNLQRPQFNIRGLRRADLTFVPSSSPDTLTRQLNRMHRLGLIKRVAGAYRYYLTRLGRAAIAAACSITENGDALMATR